MKTVLVAGGAGYIGSHVCKALKRAGMIPVTLDNFSQGHPWAVRFGPVVHASIEDSIRVRHAIEEYKPCAAIHLASSINARESLLDPFTYYQNNVAHSLQFFKTLLSCDVKFLVFSSSAAVYGKGEGALLREDAALAPCHPYGKSKLMVEEILEDFSHAYGFVSASLRYFNAAGADPEGEIGEAHTPETHLIPLALAAALGGPSLSVFGRDFPTKDGTAIRDYIHVTDLAVAHVQALLLILQEKKSLTLNLGSGQGFSVHEVVHMIERISKQKVQTYEKASIAQEPAHLVADASKARAKLNWRPNYSDLPTIIETAYKWHLR